MAAPFKCPPNAVIDSRTFVRAAYNDALGYYESARNVLGRPSMTPYEFIDTVDRQTGDRLRYIGAHADSNRFSKTKYLLEFNFAGTPEVPCEYLERWMTMMEAFRAKYPMAFHAPADQLIDKVGDLASRGTNYALKDVLPVAIVAFLVLDAYGETKASVKRRYST